MVTVSVVVAAELVAEFVRVARGATAATEMLYPAADVAEPADMAEAAVVLAAWATMVSKEML